MDKDETKRWTALFADLEAGPQVEEVADRHAELADRALVERGRIRLIDRLRPHLRGQRALRVALQGHEPLEGVLTGVGVDWLLLGRGLRPEQLLIPLAAVSWLEGVTTAAAEPGWEGVVGSRLTVRLAARRLASGTAVGVGLLGGAELTGLLCGVGRDHFELNDHRTGRGGGRLVPVSALAYLRFSTPPDGS